MPIVLVPEIIIPLAALVFLLLYLLIVASHQFVDAIAQMLRGIPKIGNFLAHGLTWLVGGAIHWVEKVFADAAAQVADKPAQFFDHLAVHIGRFFYSTANLAHSTAGAFQVLITSTIPNMIRTGTDVIGGKAFDAYRLGQFGVRLAGRIGGRLQRMVNVIRHDAALALRQALKALAVAYGATASIPLRWTEREIGRLTRELESKFTKRVRAIAAAVAAGLLTGIAVRAIARAIPWARCSNVEKVGKTICRMDHDVLDNLLAASLLFVGSLSLVEFASTVQDFFEEFDPALRFFIRELHTLENVDELNREAFLAIYGG